MLVFSVFCGNLLCFVVVVNAACRADVMGGTGTQLTKHLLASNLFPDTRLTPNDIRSQINTRQEIADISFALCVSITDEEGCFYDSVSSDRPYTYTCGVHYIFYSYSQQIPLKQMS